MKSVIILAAVAATITFTANAADLIPVTERNAATFSMAEATDPVTGNNYQTVQYPLQVVQGSQSILDQNQQAMNAELQAANDALNALAAEGQRAYDETHARIDAEVAAGNDRLAALERLASLPTLDNPIATAAAIDSNSQRLDSVEADVDELRNDVAGWSSMAAAMDSGFLNPGEWFAISGNLASVGGGQGMAINTIGRLSDSFAVNASVATDGGSAGGMVGIRMAW